MNLNTAPAHRCCTPGCPNPGTVLAYPEEDAYYCVPCDCDARGVLYFEEPAPAPEGHTLLCREVCTGDDPDECHCDLTLPGEC